MKKLLAGIRDYHERVRPTMREQFARLALGQSPDCLFIACSDSRVVVNLFASTDPGELFVVRNVGNIVPVCNHAGAAENDGSAGAAIEFATLALDVVDVVVCGHSSCGAMKAMLEGARPPHAHNLDRWLEHAQPSLDRLVQTPDFAPDLPRVDRLSQLHVLQQVEHLRSYPPIAERVANGTLKLHAWWFDLAQAEVQGFDAEAGRFRPLVQLYPASSTAAADDAAT